jgi:hypothetical protein
MGGLVALAWRPGQPIRSIAIERRDVGRATCLSRATRSSGLRR